MLTTTYHANHMSFDIRVPAPDRGQGVGSALLADLIMESDELRLPIRIWCEPDPEMCAPARLAQWYARFGFVATGRVAPGAIEMIRPCD